MLKENLLKSLEFSKKWNSESRYRTVNKLILGKKYARFGELKAKGTNKHA